MSGACTGAKKERLAEIILKLFAEHPQQTALSLQGRIAAEYRPCTLRAVYKELHRLQAAGAVVKARDLFSLSLTWILERLAFTEKLYAQALKGGGRPGWMPPENGNVTWHFRDLRRLDDFWMQLMLVLLARSERRTMFEWAPHFWFHLVHYEKELELARALERTRSRIYMIIGGDTYLDRSAAGYWSKKAYVWSFSEGPFHKDRRRYLCVVDDYVLTVRLDAGSAYAIGALFRRTAKKADLDPAEIHRVFRRPVKAAVKLEQNRKKAYALQRRFRDFFGIKGE